MPIHLNFLFSQKSKSNDFAKKKKRVTSSEYIDNECQMNC